MIESRIDNCRLAPKYPYIGISDNGCVVLFVKNGAGTCLVVGDDDGSHGRYNIGDYCTDWAESNFKPLESKIELSNK